MLGDFANLKIKPPTKATELEEIIGQLESKADSLEEQGNKDVQEKINKVRVENPEETRERHQKPHQKREKAKFAESDFPEISGS